MVFEKYIAFTAFWILAFVVFAQFISRYVFNSSIAWTEEIARYLLIYVTFLGASVAVRNRSHIAVEFMYRYMPEGMVRVTRLVLDVSVIIFACWASWLAYQVTKLTMHQTMASINLSKAWIYGMVCCSFILMAVRGVQVLIEDIRKFKQPEQS